MGMANENTVKALCTIDRTAYSAKDVRDLNRAAKLLAQHGAISAERLAKLMKQGTLSAHWCMFHLGAVMTSAGLYVAS